MALIGSRSSWAPAVALAAAFPLLAVHAQSTGSPQGRQVPLAAGLSPGPGKAQLVADCAGCHAPTIVASERHTADEWNEIVATMIGRGAQVSDADAAAIGAYLARNYGKPAT